MLAGARFKLKVVGTFSMPGINEAKEMTVPQRCTRQNGKVRKDIEEEDAAKKRMSQLRRYAAIPLCMCVLLDVKCRVL